MKFAFKNKKEARGIASTLRKVRKLIDAPEKWMKEDFKNHAETSFCVIGAVEHVNGPLELRTAEFLAANLPKGQNPKYQSIEQDVYSKYMENATKAGNLEEFLEDVYQYNDNDTRTHKQMMQYLDKCIAKAASQASA